MLKSSRSSKSRLTFHTTTLLWIIPEFSRACFETMLYVRFPCVHWVPLTDFRAIPPSAGESGVVTSCLYNMAERNQVSKRWSLTSGTIEGTDAASTLGHPKKCSIYSICSNFPRIVTKDVFLLEVVCFEIRCPVMYDVHKRIQTKQCQRD